MTTPHALTAGGLQVDLLWNGDRFAHTVSVEAAGVWHELLRSFEGGPEEDWPSSPPLQQIHFEQRGDTTVALFVGMAGRSHWSMSVEAMPDEQRIVFDIACRCGAGALPRSTYLVVRPMTSGIGSNQRSCGWRLDEGSATVTCELRREGGLEDMLLAADPGAIIIVPGFLPAAEMRTVTWRYEFVRLGG